MPLLALNSGVRTTRRRRNDLLNCLIYLLCLISLDVEAEVKRLKRFKDLGHAESEASQVYDLVSLRRRFPLSIDRIAVCIRARIKVVPVITDCGDFAH